MKLVLMPMFYLNMKSTIYISAKYKINFILISICILRLRVHSTYKFQVTQTYILSWHFNEIQGSLISFLAKVNKEKRLRHDLFIYKHESDLSQYQV